MGLLYVPFLFLIFQLYILKYILTTHITRIFKKLLILVDNKKESDSLYFNYCQSFLIII